MSAISLAWNESGLSVGGAVVVLVRIGVDRSEDFVVDAVGYPAFFMYTASLSIPALILLYFIAKRGITNDAAQAVPK